MTKIKVLKSIEPKTAIIPIFCTTAASELTSNPFTFFASFSRYICYHFTNGIGCYKRHRLPVYERVAGGVETNIKSCTF